MDTAIKGCLVLAFVVLVNGASFSGTPSLNTNNPPVYSKLEISFSLGNSYNNAYDPSEINVHAQFNGPAGESLNIPCFPFQKYDQSSSNYWNADGPMAWLCRFAPVSAGQWSYGITASDQSSTAVSNGTFSAAKSLLPGFIQRSSKDNRYFVRSDSQKTHWAVGENIAWWDNGIHDYDNWVSRLASAGGNYMRIWIGATQFGFAIEEKLGDYDSTQQKAAWLDYLVDMAQSKGVTILMCINFHGDFSTTVNSNWGKNPYNSALGGPLNNPSEVWTNGDAISLFERRYRYIAARWAYSTAVHSWELWNEMDWIDNFSSDQSQAAAWHSHFYAYMRSVDPFKHVITTSFAEDQNDKSVDATVDFTQIHSYAINDFVTDVQGYVPAHVSYYKTPCWFGEMGTSWESGGDCVSEDPTGISLHNVQWASLIFGAGGGGYCWWWDSYIDPQNLYHVFTGITQFLEGEQLDTHQYTTIQPSLSDGQLRSWALSGSDGYALGWVQASAHTWSNMHNGGGVPTVNSPQVTFACYNKYNNNTVEIWNTYTGSRISYAAISCDNGQYSFNLPTIDGNNPDYAFKIYPGGPQNHTNPTPPPSGGLPDWTMCTLSNQCQDNCCSKQYSNDGNLKCTPGGSSNMCVTGNLADWDFCTVSSQCADGCCSKQYSSDGKYKCTPGGAVSGCI